MENNVSESNGPAMNLNLNVRGLKPSATLAINERCAALARDGKKVFKMGLGQSPFPVPESVVKTLQENAYQKEYLPVKGLPDLREAVAQYHCRKQGIRCNVDDVLIGPGSKELMFLIQLVYYGDLVIPTPSWVSYAPQAQIIGHHVHWVPTRSADNWLLQPDMLEEICKDDPDRPRLLILNYPNNPTGHTYPVDHLEALAKFARKHRVVLLSDEIYAEIHHKGKHTSIAEFYPEGTIISSGLSKWCGAGGWRLGTFTFPKSLQWLQDAMAVVASETFTATSAPIQYAAVCAFHGGPEIEAYLVHCRQVLRALGEHCSNHLAAAGIKVRKPDGAFYLFPSFTPFKPALEARGIRTNMQLCETLLHETGVAVLPGVSFGRPDYKLSMRIAYVDFNGSKALKAVESMPASEKIDETFLREYCSNVTTAIDRICGWVQDLSI